ncbi:MAG: aminotransferase class V-fold PLP-dependent enzyme, partial [Planctomycetes bacterium]|nr:aminotransferase class V-fold PLP-dependent enzyme [Planctomycetota bacterium]
MHLHAVAAAHPELLADHRRGDRAAGRSDRAVRRADPVAQLESRARVAAHVRLLLLEVAHRHLVDVLGIEREADAALRRAMDDAGHPAMLFVDAVSSLASIDFNMDEWGVDICVSGSQKGFMMPAGLAILGVSQKALGLRKAATFKRCYFDFEDMIKTNKDGYFPYTPPTQMLRGLRAA